MNRSLLFVVLLLLFSQIETRTVQQFLRGHKEANQQQKCQGVIFDAGSSGTRVYVYTWPCRINKYQNPEIEIKQEAPSSKKTPGISSFASNIEGLESYMQTLIDFANNNVEQSKRKQTPILLAATAGMRILNNSQQDQILKKIQQILSKSGYLFQTNDWARIISGQDEGAYLWLSVNYLKNNFQSNNVDDRGQLSNSYATIDIGGASTQFAEQIKEQDSFYSEFKDSSYKTDYFTQSQYVQSIELYSNSWLYFGMDQANILINNYLIKQIKDSNQVLNPCFQQGYQSQQEKYTIVGSGKPDECRNLINKFLIGFDKSCDKCYIQESVLPPLPKNAKIFGSGVIEFAGKLIKKQNFVWPDLDQTNTQCTQTLNEEQKKDKYFVLNCFLGLYTQELLSIGYRVPKDITIETGNIQGLEPSWTLAAMFDQIDDNESCSDSPHCNFLLNMKSLISNQKLPIKDIPEIP